MENAWQGVTHRRSSRKSHFLSLLSFSSSSSILKGGDMGWAHCPRTCPSPSSNPLSLSSDEYTQILRCQERAGWETDGNPACALPAPLSTLESETVLHAPLTTLESRNNIWNNSVALRKKPWLRVYFIYLLRESFILILPMSVWRHVNMCMVALRGQSCWRHLESTLEGVVSCLTRALGKEFRSPARTVCTLDFFKISLVSSVYIFVAFIYLCVCVCMCICV